VEPLFLFLTCPVVLCPDSARLCEKIPQARRARMIFSANPQGRALQYPPGHRATFAGEKEIVYVFLIVLLGNVE